MQRQFARKLRVYKAILLTMRNFIKPVLIKQAAIGLLIVVISYFAAADVCERDVPGTMVKYLTEFGELIVGATIAVVLVIFPLCLASA